MSADDGMPVIGEGRVLLPEEVPVDAFVCGACGAVLWLLGQGPVVHDCATGVVAAAP